MSPWHPTQDKILFSLSEGEPLTSNQIVTKTRLTKHSIWSTLKRCWENGLILRSQKPIYESKKKFRGRKGYRTNTRGYYKYARAHGGDKFYPHTQFYGLFGIIRGMLGLRARIYQLSIYK